MFLVQLIVTELVNNFRCGVRIFSIILIKAKPLSFFGESGTLFTPLKQIISLRSSLKLHSPLGTYVPNKMLCNVGNEM
jgi:hypothetical protein